MPTTVAASVRAARAPAASFNASRGSSRPQIPRAVTQQASLATRVVRCSAAAEGAEEAEEAADFVVPTRLNTYPMPRHMRHVFYEDLSTSLENALAGGVKRMQMRCTIPETNPEMDVYRIGTVLEALRMMATAAAKDGKKVKICIQQALGQGFLTGMPLALSGVKRIMEAMDWGDAEPFVSLGEVSADEVDDSEVYILVCPQNVVNGALIPSLMEMADEVEAKDKTIVLFNPILKDVPSSSGLMGVRGRKERMTFVNSFDVVYHFRLLYSGAAFYPIRGALRHAYGEGWTVYKRIEKKKLPDDPIKPEEYEIIGKFESEPKPADITKAFRATF